MYFHCVCLFHSTQFFAASIILRYFSFTSSGLLICTLPSNPKSQPKNISFEFHLKNRHEKTQKPLWFLGFQPRYLFRCYLLVAGEGLDSHFRGTRKLCCGAWSGVVLDVHRTSIHCDAFSSPTDLCRNTKTSLDFRDLFFVGCRGRT